VKRQQSAKDEFTNSGLTVNSQFPQMWYTKILNVAEVRTFLSFSGTLNGSSEI